METGIQQGLQRGKQEQMALIMCQLTRKIGTVEPELQEHIRGLSITKIEDLAEALLDFSNTEDLVSWLNEQ